ncbi:FkbM family methyltransferase [Vineibacter terrae]|uniref:FkbM family methyltransferase n=1 Tax=Vineibacter terrae TaxID=2586908 RepID=A0A5C8P8F0_9HYPH|nr:FkbM family methyltransferase [Vineibacter terrae]TXL70071.1 FkbM family methyltransferase [Vineibacter terrae]
MFTTLQQVAAIGRSLWVYHGDPARHRRMDQLYARFMRRGDLVFDIGAHVGDRIRCFRRLGCRVVALEPQASLVRVLRLLYGRAEGVTILEAAAGARSGTLELHLNPANPTVATGSTGFIAAADGSPGWERERWTGRVTVPLTTLDALIAQHGEPAFIKIDVEGLEEAVLQGLSCAVRALSFEFTTIQRGVAVACLQRCAALGSYRFNAALGESQVLAHESWLDDAAMARWLMALPHAANSGDVYAVRADVAA